MNLYKDPLVRRFLTGTALTTLFVWVAIRYFNVRTDVVLTFLVGSFVFIGGLILLALLASFMLRGIRRLLSNRNDPEP